MRFVTHFYFSVFIFCSVAVYSQATLKSGFDAQEFLDVLHLEWAHQDTNKYAPKKLPAHYKRVYRSPNVGLNNKFDFWLSDDSIGVICIRYTVGGSSWLENLYSGMIRATGTMHLNDSTNFHYKFSNDDKALVHHGWAIGACHLAPLITKTINDYHKKGVKQFIIVGHSQGAALAYLIRSYLEYAPDSVIPKDITYKVYGCAAPKPGNMFYAYDYDFITRNGWAYRIVNTSDWVPQTPFSTQSIYDLHPVNPYTNRKAVLHKRVKSPFVRWYVNHAVKDIESAATKTNRKYKKYLTKRVNQYVKKVLTQYQSPEVIGSNAYAPAGIPIILQPNAQYDSLFKFDGENVFVHHLFEPYIYLTEFYYLKK